MCIPRQLPSHAIPKWRVRSFGEGLGRALVLFVAAFVGSVIVSSRPAAAVDFFVEHRTSTYAVDLLSDDYASLVLEHQSGSVLGSQTVTSIENISSQTLPIPTTSNYSTLITTVLNITLTGSYTFEVGTDWGRGGASQIYDLTDALVIDETVTDQNIWWANNWSNPTVFSSTVVLQAGHQYALGWVGFEDCCGGVTTMRFSVDGSPPVTLTDTNLVPFVVPEPGTALLLGAGLGLLGLRARADRFRR